MHEQILWKYLAYHISSLRVVSASVPLETQITTSSGSVTVDKLNSYLLKNWLAQHRLTCIEIADFVVIKINWR